LRNQIIKDSKPKEADDGSNNAKHSAKKKNSKKN
jgi:hypothetical protein